VQHIGQMWTELAGQRGIAAAYSLTRHMQRFLQGVWVCIPRHMHGVAKTSVSSGPKGFREDCLKAPDG